MSEHESSRPHEPGEPGARQPSPGRKIGGIILMIIGIAIMLPTGSCALMFMRQDPGTALVLGGAPFLIGLGIFFGGRRLMKG